MKTRIQEQKAAARKALKLAKELKKAQELLEAVPREDRSLFREEADDITAQLAWALILCGRYEEALAFAMKLPKKTHSVDRYLCEGTALIDLGQYDAAKAVLEKGLRKHRKSVPILVSLGNCYSHLYRFEDALACCDAALKLDPRESKVHFNKASVLFNLKLYEDALEILTKLLKRWPRDPMCNALAGHCNLYRGYPEDAVKFIKKALELGDDDPMNYDSLYWAYRDMGLLNDAIALAQEAIRRYPSGDPDLYRDLAGGYLEMDWVDEAREVLKKGLEIFPGNPDLKEILDALDEDPEDGGGEEVEAKPKPLILVIDGQRQGIERP